MTRWRESRNPGHQRTTPTSRAIPGETNGNSVALATSGNTRRSVRLAELSEPNSSRQRLATIARRSWPSLELPFAPCEGGGSARSKPELIVRPSSMSIFINDSLSDENRAAADSSRLLRHISCCRDSTTSLLAARRREVTRTPVELNGDVPTPFSLMQLSATGVQGAALEDMTTATKKAELGCRRYPPLRKLLWARRRETAPATRISRYSGVCSCRLLLRACVTEVHLRRRRVLPF